MINFNSTIASNDLAVVPVPSSTPIDKRILTAEELSLGQQMQIRRESRIPSGWLSSPSLDFVGDRTLRIQGSLRSSLLREAIAVEGDAVLPALSDTISVVARDDFISLIVFVAEVGIDHDSSLSVKVTEEEMDGNGNLTGLTVTQFDGENTHRYRLFWGLIHSQSAITESAFWELLVPSDPVDKFRNLVVTTGSDGFVLGENQFYAIDPNLVSGKTYPVLKTAIEVFPLCSVVRQQNYSSHGYQWGSGGEKPLLVDFNIKPWFKRADIGVEAHLVERAYGIMAGKPGTGFCYTRTVKNLLGGEVGSPSEQEGELTRSPSGSYIIANGQRISFTNQRILQDSFCQVVWSQYDSVSHRVLLTASADIDSPVSTQFADSSYHRIFDANGVEQTDLGEFLSPDGYNTVTWVAGVDSSFYVSGAGSFVSKKAYFIPAIYFASGSGFSEFFVEIEKVWNNGQSISLANVRDGENDLGQYVDPVDGSTFIVVHGRERAAIHYIYKKITLITSGTGVASVPDNIGGNFAFVQGQSIVEGDATRYRFNVPILTGLTPLQSINALVYYPPKSAGDDWQFQMKVSPYQGIGLATNGADFLNGATVISACRFFVHTLGGGGSCFHGEGMVRRSPVSFVLPAVLGGTPSYELNAPIHFAGEGYPGPVNFREIEPIAGVDFALPTHGMMIYTVPATAIAHPRSLNVALFGGDGAIPLGFGTPTFAKSTDQFQFVLCFVVEKEGEKRIVIATHNGVGGVSYALDTSALTAIDLFYL